MTEEGTAVGTGGTATLVNTYEEREIVIAEGNEFHSSDRRARTARRQGWGNELIAGPTPERYREISAEVYEWYETRWPENPSRETMRKMGEGLQRGVETALHDELSAAMGAQYVVNSDTESQYTSDPQKVNYRIRIVYTKPEFKTALETEGICVMYNGHARWGRGPCFDVYNSEATKHGNQWEDGTNQNNGLYRMGYPFIPVGLSDLKKHQYTCRPVKAEDPKPPATERHPQARGVLRAVTLPEDVRLFVAASHQSPSHRYWGFTRERQAQILLQSGWTDTVNRPYDLDGTDLRCKCFCHFGCSTKIHNWEIVRKANYKGWVRPDPPTDRYAYFTTKTADFRVFAVFPKYWFKYPNQNNHQPWWESLQWARQKANRELTAIRAGYQIY
jgi:hypothetical protein